MEEASQMINEGLGRCEFIKQTPSEVLMKHACRKGTVSVHRVIPRDGEDVTQRLSSELSLLVAGGPEDRLAEPFK